MENRIIIKEIDKFLSAVHEGYIITEYLIYLSNGPYQGGSRPLEAYTELGEKAKNARVNELILLHFISDDPTVEEPKKEDIIEEISFDEYAKELKLIWNKK